MKYLFLALLLSGCSVNKDVHDMNDRLGLMARKMQENTDEMKREKEIAPMTDFSSKQKQQIENIPQVDISQKSEAELTDLATKAQRVAENPPPIEQTTVPPVDVQDPPTNIPPQKQALIYRIKAYLRQIFRRKQ